MKKLTIQNKVNKKNKDYRILIIIFSLFYFNLFSQAPMPLPPLPTVIPPSPTAQNFMRYGEIPVDYSTGVPKIEIPIYTIQGKQLQLPLSISYHASGIKVIDVASEVGLGWVLNAGGIVSRTVLDTKDELGREKTYSTAEEFLNAKSNIVYYSANSTLAGVENLESYLNTKYNGEDLMSDRYFYRLPNGISGVFRYSYPQQNLIMLPYRPYKINKTIIQNGYEKIVSEINITDDEGVTYKYQRFVDSGSGTSEWFLKEMKSADQKETITFNYIAQETRNSANYSSIFLTKKDFSGDLCDPTQVESYPTVQVGVNPNSNYSQVLSSIESDDVIVNFSYSDREDFTHLKKLSEITVKAKKNLNETKLRFALNHSYFGTVGSGYQDNDKRLKLNSFTTYHGINVTGETHSFTYQNQILPPYSSRAYDFWGYYNGNTGTLAPDIFLPAHYQNSGYGGNRKADDGTLGKACMLTEIKYPTGGKTKFEFERHFADALYGYVPENQRSGYIGGFRVNSITNYLDDTTVSNTKSYLYPGVHFQPVSGEYFNSYQDYVDFYVYGYNEDITGIYIEHRCTVTYNRQIVNSEPLIPINVAPGLPIVYTKVIEYDGTPQHNNGSSEFFYNLPHYMTYPEEIREIHPYQDDLGNYAPQLTSQVIKNGSGNKIKEDIYSYSNHFLQEFQTGINITRNMSLLYLDGPYYNLLWYYLMISTSFVPSYLHSLKAHNTKAYQSSSLLDYSIEKVYDQSNQNKFVEQRIDYEYNQHNLKVKESKQKNSLDENILTEFKYPYDFSSSQPYSTLINRNVLSPIIEQKLTNTSINKEIQKIKYDYKDWGNNILAPEYIKVQDYVQNSLENRIRYFSYNEKGNPYTVKKEGSLPITYLWGYDKKLPIAKIDNAIYSEQIFSQNDNIGNFSFNLPMQINQQYPIGTFTLSEERTMTLDRNYEKAPDHEVTFYITISSPGFSIPQISDYIPRTTTSSSPSSTITLPAGTYTVGINAGYGGNSGSSQYQHDITIGLFSNSNYKKTIPFHTSFEDDTENVTTVYAKTGNKSHSGSYNLRIPPASFGYNKVLVSYWGKANGTSSWVYVEEVFDANGIDRVIGHSYQFIDEVRMYPVDALMTTYTYDSFNKNPTSVMQPNNKVEFYKYDYNGRLTEVKDESGNLLKENEYHFKP